MINFDDIPSLTKAAAARDAWSLDPLTTDALRDALRDLLRDEAAVYPLTAAPRAATPDDLVHRLEGRYQEMMTLLGIVRFDRARFPELFDTIKPLTESLAHVVDGLAEKGRLLAANPQAADSQAKIASLEEAFDAIDEHLAHGFAVVARTLAQAPRIKAGVRAATKLEPRTPEL